MAGAFRARALQATLTECLVFVECATLELYWLGSRGLLRISFFVGFGIGAALKAALRWCTQHLLDIIVAIIITQLIGECSLASLSFYVLVDAGSGAVGEKRLVIEVVVLIVAKSLTKTSSLIEQTLVKHDIASRRLRLP